METVEKNSITLGLIIKSLSEGSVPVTKENEPLQLVTLKHSSGVILKAHKHTPKIRTTNNLQECLIIKKGKISVGIYDQSDNFFKKITLSTGDAYIVMNGGIEINFLEDSEILEIKNGPFFEDKVNI